MFGASKSGSAALPSDPDFEYVTLLLDGNGTNGGQNNTFVDSSTNNFTITRNGNTTQGSFSPYGTLWSNYFNGASDWLTASTNTAFALGSGDFTVEGFVYITSVPNSYNAIYDNRLSGGSSAGFWIAVTSGRVIVCRNTSDFVSSGSNLVALNQWNHIAVVRSGSTMTIYLNGTSVGSSTVTTNWTDNAFWINRVNDITTLNGVQYISNFRIVKGTAVYTSAFTPSTTPLTAITNTSLLTCQSSRFVDNSSNAFVITPSGAPSVQRFSPFEPSAPYSTSVIGGSGYFDGSDYLTAPDNSAFTIHGGNWTIEAWIYPTLVTGYQTVITRRSAIWEIGLEDAKFYWYNGTVYSTTATVNRNTWNHVAVTWDGTSTRLYINGNLERTVSGANAGSGTGAPAIGAVPSQYFNGYITDLRVLKGTALYTGSTYTIPTAPLTAISNTSLLLSYTNASIADLAMMNDLETVGNAQVSTSVKKYGTGSLAFDGTGDYLQGGAFSSPVHAIGSGNFTIECWIYTNANKTQIIFDNGTVGGSSTSMQAALNSSGYPYFVIANSIVLTSSIIVNTTTWTHVAWVRNNGTIAIYVNGTSGGSASNTTNISDTGLTIGTPNDYRDTSTSFHFNGYIDDLRITIGIARYTANFTAPTAPFPTY